MAKKKKPKNKKPSKRYAKYKMAGDKLERQPSCPRCGNGIFLALHKDRQTCGHCGYTVFQGKK